MKMSPQIRIVKGNNGLFLLLGASLEKCEKVEKNEKTYFFNRRRGVKFRKC